VTINGAEYVLEKYLPSKRPRHPYVCDHGIGVVVLGTSHGAECDEAHHPQLYNAATTVNAQRHLKIKHGIVKPGAIGVEEETEEEESGEPSQLTID
jgi:hypothetical protein